MLSKKAKFCLSRCVEEFYFEEDGNDSCSDDYSRICQIFHQNALTRSQQTEIQNKIQNVFNQQSYQFNYTSDGNSLHTSNSELSSISRPNLSSFNRMKYDLVHNQVNYFRPNEFHKQRQSDILPIDRYEHIIKDSPFDSPLESAEKVQRRATVLPNFKAHFINQSTQTSYNNSKKDVFQNNEINDDVEILPIYRQSTSESLKPNHTNSRLSTRSPSVSTKEISRKNISTKNSSTNTPLNSSNKLTSQTSKNITINRSDVVASLKNSINQSIKKSINKSSSIKKSANNSTQNKIDNKLKDVSNVSDHHSKFNQIDTTKKSKRKSKYYDKSDYISFSKAYIHEPDDSIKDHLQTELIESLLDSSTFDNLNLESLINKRSTRNNSTKFSARDQTKNRSGTFTNSTTVKSVKKSNSMNLEQNDEKTNKSTNRSKNDVSKFSTSKTNENNLIKSILKQPIQQVDIINRSNDENEMDDLSDVSLILNSTCSQEEKETKSKTQNDLKPLDDNLELDLSIIGFDTSMQSDVEIVFEEEAIKPFSEPNPKSLYKIDEEIEMCRDSSFNNHSSPQLSIGNTSIDETLSQPESLKENLKNKSKTDQSEVKSPEPLEQNIELSVDFESDFEKSPIRTRNEPILDQKTPKSISLHEQQFNSLKSTPKSILKKDTSKRIWEASEFSLVNLTIGSSINKSLSSHRKNSNSVRFSDKISEKFSNNSSFRRDDKIVQSVHKSLDQSIDRSISESISKRIDEVIDASRTERTESKENMNDCLPDLEDSYKANDENDEINDASRKSIESKKSSYDSEQIESDEESLNVTIDELSESLNEIENEEDEEINENDQTSTNTPEKKNQTTFTVKSLKKNPINRPTNRDVATIRKQLPKYYETFVDKTPTIIYPNSEETDSNVRRSNRIRVRPLDFWRCQNPKYTLDKETKCLKIDGIQKGFTIDNPFGRKRTVVKRPKRSNKKSKDKKSKKRKHHSTIDEDDEIVIKRKRHSPDEEISIHQQLNESAVVLSDRIKKEATEYCSHNELKWTESKQSKGVFIAFMNRGKNNDGNVQATGFMKLTSLLKKPPQKTGNYLTNYVVMFGAASVRIADKKDDKLDDKPSVILKSMDGFTVKDNTLFSIDNLRKDELLLYFNLTKL